MDQVDQRRIEIIDNVYITPLDIPHTYHNKVRAYTGIDKKYGSLIGINCNCREGADDMKIFCLFSTAFA
jgi:hypothetical protein